MKRELVEDHARFNGAIRGADNRACMENIEIKILF